MPKCFCFCIKSTLNSIINFFSKKSYLYYDQTEKIKINIPKTKKGIPMWYKIAKGPKFKQAAAYAAMKRDLNDCKESLKLLKGYPKIDKTIHSALIFSTIIKYARCYTSASQGRGVSLQQSNVFKGPNSHLKDFHNRTMKIRHSYLAHAGESDYESGEITLLLNPDVNNKQVEYRRFSSYSLNDDIEKIDKHIAIVEASIQYVDEQIKKITPTIKAEVNSMSINDIYKDAKKPDPNKLEPFLVKYIK
jgi:hypothetical protein